VPERAISWPGALFYSDPAMAKPGWFMDVAGQDLYHEFVEIEH
jgi:hypothetical protein